MLNTIWSCLVISDAFGHFCRVNKRIMFFFKHVSWPSRAEIHQSSSRENFMQKLFLLLLQIHLDLHFAIQFHIGIKKCCIQMRKGQDSHGCWHSHYIDFVLFSAGTPSQSWDHYTKDGHRKSSSGANTPVKTWDGLKTSNVVSQLEKLSKYGYGTQGEC